MYKYPEEDIYIGDIHNPPCPKCGEKVIDNGGCSAGCCDDYKCTKCGYEFRMEWPD